MKVTRTDNKIEIQDKETNYTYRLDLNNNEVEKVFIDSKTDPEIDQETDPETETKIDDDIINSLLE